MEWSRSSFIYILSRKPETNAVVRTVTSITMINGGFKVIIYLYIVMETRDKCCNENGDNCNND